MIIYSLSLFLTLLFPVSSLIDPARFQDTLRALLPHDTRLLALDLGRTANGYNIIAYGLTAIPDLPPTIDVDTLAHYPSSLLTAYMHPRDEHTVDLLFLALQVLLDRSQSDYETRLMLMTGIVWSIPYISIDSYEHLIRVGQLSQ